MQMWNDMRVSKWWVNYPFKGVKYFVVQKVHFFHISRELNGSVKRIGNIYPWTCCFAVSQESYPASFVMVLPVKSQAGILSFQETCKPPNWVWHQSLSFICVIRSCCDRPFTLVGLSAAPQALHSDNEVGSAGPRFMDVQLISVKLVIVFCLFEMVDED